ncbi:serine protease [Caulobacter sp. CCUG 60055]|uniref:Do family serine endopeptidase n=1 Tax=Caulobacter sp. CCUG 60055 TaxID=2100090 RepID=UPI001FA8118E|nr:Do family serine endopeptidase [Caulobacter sp. CCUG 60055]MBQ1540790.1 Do family serine endopeptidase [Caulobacteraceae bacterium]MCI3179339.1 serine protease [Caulobacter sp. CCUG 60055]
MRAARVLIPALAVLAACSDPAAKSSAQNLPGPPLAEPARHVPGDVAAMKMSFAPVVKKAAPAVVNVYSQRVVRQRVDPFWDFFMGGGGVPRNRVEKSLGSGVLVRADGVVVTNNHVVDGMQEIMVVLSDRREFPAKVLLADPRTDLAVLKIDAKGERLPVLAIDDREQLQVGDLVLAIGDPFGVGQTVTNGIISAVNRTAEAGGDPSSYIQTDAAINPGNSGGALVDMDGDLIGVNSFILSRSGTSSGVGFAIPAAMVRRVVETAVGGGSAFVRPWLGVRGQPVTSEIARSLNLDRPQGVLVGEIYPGGPADRAGLKPGDLILSIDNQPVDDPAGINYRVSTHRPGDDVTLQIRRDKTPRSLTAKVQPPPATPARDERVIAGRNPLEGATVVNLSPAVADELGADPFAGGTEGVVVVTKVGQGYAVRAGLQPGDILRAVNGKAVRSTRDVEQAVQATSRRWQITVQRGEQVITGNFSL